MKNLLMFLLISMSLVLVSCKDDDSDPVQPEEKAAIVGTWVSDGNNVAYGLRATLKVAKIVATFNENSSYSFVQTDSSGVSTTYNGTYTFIETTYTDTLTGSFTNGAKVYNMVASQTTPAITASGIAAVSGNNMSYEVIQTSPALTGVNAPTAAGGFGSTTVGGVSYAIYIQKYVKQ
ncbi:MAG: hypothetical protein R6W90_10020 [Ignavibacteriaceae bacterium]